MEINKRGTSNILVDRDDGGVDLGEVYWVSIGKAAIQPLKEVLTTIKEAGPLYEYSSDNGGELVFTQKGDYDLDDRTLKCGVWVEIESCPTDKTITYEFAYPAGLGMYNTIYITQSWTGGYVKVAHYAYAGGNDTEIIVDLDNLLEILEDCEEEYV